MRSTWVVDGHVVVLILPIDSSHFFLNQTVLVCKEITCAILVAEFRFFLL